MDISFGSAHSDRITGVSLVTSVNDFTCDELRQLRRRLGWSQAELARVLNVGLNDVVSFESGVAAIPFALKGSLVRFSVTADSNADSCQRRALSEGLMDEQRLAQIPLNFVDV